MYNGGVKRLVEVLHSITARTFRRTVSIALALYDHDAVQKASAMAFWLFLGFVPLAAILGWVLATFAGTEIRDSIVGSVFSVAPQPAQALVDEHLHRLIEQGGVLAPLSFVGFLWISAGGLHTAMTGIQEAQTGKARSWWLNRVVAILFILGFLAVVTLSSAILVMALAHARQALQSGRVEAWWATLVRVGALPMSVVIATLAAAIFFSVSVPTLPDFPRRRVWPGALASGLSWVIMSWGLTGYSTTIGRFPFFYGSLAAVALVQLWLWCSCFLLLLGSEVNIQLEGVRETIVPKSLRFWKKPPAPDNDR